MSDNHLHVCKLCVSVNGSYTGSKALWHHIIAFLLIHHWVYIHIYSVYIHSLATLIGIDIYRLCWLHTLACLFALISSWTHAGCVWVFCRASKAVFVRLTQGSPTSRPRVTSDQSLMFSMYVSLTWGMRFPVDLVYKQKHSSWNFLWTSRTSSFPFHIVSSIVDLTISLTPRQLLSVLFSFSSV